MMLLLLLACAEPAAPEGELLALTYNVAGLPQGLSGSDPERNMPLIAPLLGGYPLVLVQEDFSYHEQLDAGAPHAYRSEPSEPRERPVGDGLNRFSDYPLGPLTRVQWVACNGTVDDSNDCLAEKGFSVGEVGLAEGVDLLVYNHHAEAGGNEGDVAARAQGYAQLAEHIATFAGDRAVLMAGDTNLHRADAEDALLLDAFLEDTAMADLCAALACGEDHIDRFFFRSGADLALDAVGWGVATEFVDEDGEPLSDHPALRGTLSWSLP